MKIGRGTKSTKIGREGISTTNVTGHKFFTEYDTKRRQSYPEIQANK